MKSKITIFIPTSILTICLFILVGCVSMPYRNSSAIQLLAISPSGEMIACVENETITMRTVKDFSITRLIIDHSDRVTAIKFITDSVMVSCSAHQIITHDPHTGTKLSEYNTKQNFGQGFLSALTGSTNASMDDFGIGSVVKKVSYIYNPTDYSSKVRVRDLEKFEIQFDSDMWDNRASGSDMNRDGSLIAAIADPSSMWGDAKIFVWKTSSPTPIYTIRINQDLYSLKFSVDDEIVFIGTNKGVKSYRAGDGSFSMDIATGFRADDVALSPDGQLIATRDHLGTNPIQVWRTKDGTLLKQLAVNAAMVFSQNSTELIVGSGDNLIRFDITK